MDTTWLPWATQRLHIAVKSKATWGYVIYRTTYTPQSDIAFLKMIESLNGHIKKELFSEAASKKDHKLHSTKPTPCEEIWSHHLPIIMENRLQFENASTESIHSHFSSWVKAAHRSNQNSLYRMCIVIDEESLQEFLSASLPGNHSDEEIPKHPFRFVKVMAASPATDTEYTYDAFLGGDCPVENPEIVKVRRDKYRQEANFVSESDDDEYDGFLGG